MKNINQLPEKKLTGYSTAGLAALVAPVTGRAGTIVYTSLNADQDGDAGTEFSLTASRECGNDTPCSALVAGQVIGPASGFTNGKFLKINGSTNGVSSASARLIGYAYQTDGASIVAGDPGLPPEPGSLALPALGPAGTADRRHPQQIPVPVGRDYDAIDHVGHTAVGRWPQFAVAR